MARRANQELAFTALSIEGGLLAPDFLNKVAHLEATEQSESDYDIPRGLKLRDEIGRYWKIAQNLWQDFSAKRSRTDIDAHAVTVREFLEPFCRQVLGFADLKAVGQVTLGERIFPIGFAAGEGRVPLVFAAHDQGLDKPSNRHGDGVRRRSPFLLAQEYLNAHQPSLWAVVSNGLKLRVLRDNPSLTRPAYIEADLEAVFAEGLYPDFTALWLLAHGTRFGKANPEVADCPLERWRNTAQQDGIRARDRLRDGVTEALRALGTGFLAHKDNTELRRRIEAGELSTQAYFEQLLRLIYRLIFLATIEDRELVFAPDASAEAKARYLAGYSLRRLRSLAARRRSYDRHADLWQVFTISFAGLGRGQPALGLPALGGIFDAAQCLDLDASQLENQALLSALFSLCFFREGAALSRVNYRDMDSEELGSVYESLLELVPLVTLAGDARRFGFVGDEEQGSTKGNARKLTGSYYTPDSLVQELIKSALDPVIAQTLAAHPQEPVKALLNLSVCDPASGSGHFLLAAARRIAEEVARLAAPDANPLPADYRHALRDVVAHCIYGVDKNPMAVELARTALWLEAYTPDRPLTFLDAHLRCGDALLGVLDPAILEAGIPDKAFNYLSGDDKEVVKRIKKANRDALKAITKASAPTGQFRLGLEAEADAVAFETLPDDTLDALKAKRAAFQAMQARVGASRARLAADLFVAAFVLPKTSENERQVPTSQDLWLVQNGSAPRPGVAEAANRAAEAAQAFHWWQAFPHIQIKGGFDVLLGNPPWERIKLQEEEFFASRSPLVAEAPHKAERGRRIGLLAEGMLLHTQYPEVEAAQGLVPPNTAEQALYAKFLAARRNAEAASLFAHDAGRYPLTGVGDVNTYALFAETFAQLVSANGRAGFIVPTGIATDDSTKAFFSDIVTRRQLSRLLSLYEIRGWFKDTDDRKSFCLLTLGYAEAAEFLFDAKDAGDFAKAEKWFRLSSDDFRLLNPNTLTCPVFHSQRDADMTKKLYRAAPILVSEGPPECNHWGIRFMTMFHMSNDSHLFADAPTAGLLPLYEAKLIHQFDHRWASYDVDGGCQDVAAEEKTRPEFTVIPRYWVAAAEVNQRLADKRCEHAWLMGWRDIALRSVERTVIASVVPRVGVGNQMPLMLFAERKDKRVFAALLGNLSALVFDFVARHKVGGTHLNYFVYKQLPVLPPNRYIDADLAFIVPRVLELTYTAHDLKPWAEDLGRAGPPFPWNPERRARLRAELDAYYARLYGLTRDELRYILDPADVMGEDYPSETFRVLKNNEYREFGEYRTQRLVLEAWDKLEAGDMPGSQAEPAAPTIVYGDHSVIQNADEAELAGLLTAVLAQQPSGLSSVDLQAMVAHAATPGYADGCLDAASASRLRSLMGECVRVESDSAIRLIPQFLYRLEDCGALRRLKRGDTVVYVPGAGPLPADVTLRPEHAELAMLLLALDAKRKGAAEPESQVGGQSTEQRGAV